VVDAPGQSSAGDLELFTAGPHFGYTRAANRRVYEHAALGRRLINAGIYTLDIAGAAANRPAVFDYALHVSGSLDDSNLVFAPADAPLADTPAYSHLENLHSNQADGDWVSRWKTDSDATGERFFLTVLGAPNSQFHLATTPWAGDQKRSTVLVSREGKSADYVAVWRVGPETDPITSIERIGKGEPTVHTGALKLNLADGQTDYMAWNGVVRSGRIGPADYRARDFFLRLDEAGEAAGATIIEGDRFALEAFEINASMPATWSWQALPGNAFLLIQDDAYPVTFQIKGGDSVFSVHRLDKDANFSEVPASGGHAEAQSWVLAPGANFIFSPKGHAEPALTILSHRIVSN
jgi:hypothetical protein